jgi:hypothetical protein
MANLLSTTVNGQLNTGNVIDLGYTVNGSIATTAFRGINFHSFDDYSYLIGKRAGAWTQPLDITFYTGIKYHAHRAYGGHKFYTGGFDSDFAFSIGDGDNLVRVADRIIVNGTMNVNYDQVWTSSGNLHLQYSGSGNIDMNYGGGYAFSRTSLRAPIFYDYNDTNYYLDPNGTSNLLQLNTATRARWNMPRAWFDRSSRTSDQGYWTGTNGWAASDGTWANAWQGGFSGWDIWGEGIDHPQSGQGYVHAQGIVSGQHYATSSVGYGWMMVGAHNATANRYWLRGKWDTTTSGWVEMITTGNIASQSVSYAVTSGTSSATTQTNFSELSIGGLGVATREYVTSQGYLTSLPSHNHDDRYLVKGGSWYGSGLPGSRWGGFTVSGGEIVFGDGLPNAGQMGILIDGAYVAGENNGFWSLASDNSWGSRRGMYWDGTYLNFTTNTPPALFSDVRAPIFYDSNDTGFYLDPNGTSNLNKFSERTMAFNDMNPKSINSPYVDRYNGSVGYRNGTMGYANTDFNTIARNWGSGFIDTWSSPANAPGGSSHYIGLQGVHYSDGGTSFYGFQMACAGEADNRFFWRSSWPSMRSWVEMIHSGNIGSQSVSYASSAGSVAWNNVTSKPSLDYQQDYVFTAPNSTDGSGYSWVRITMGGFNSGGDFVRFSIARAIGWNGASPYGGPSMDVVAYSREWHGGQEGAVITYAQHGSVPGNGWVTNAGPRDLAGGGYWFYMRIWGGVDYAMRVYRGSGPIGSDWQETSDPGSVYKIKDGVNNVGNNGTGFNTNGEVLAPIYYDYSDQSYYGDFNGRSVLNSLQLGTASSDTTNLKLDVQGNMAIRGSNGLFFGVSTNNYNSWSTKIYASGSTQYFNAQTFIFDNQGYGSTTFVTINSAGVYTNGWFRNYGNQGIYNQDYGTHFYSNSAEGFVVTGSGGIVQLQFRSNHQSTLRGYVYADTSNNIGFLNDGGSWSLRMSSSRNAEIFGPELTINAANAGYSSINMNDGDEGQRIIHCNSNRVGFLTQAGAWGSWCDDDGGWNSVGNISGNYLYSNYSIRVGEIWGLGGVYRSSGDMLFGTEGAGWSFRSANSEKVYIATDGNIYMAWAGAYISTLLDAKQNASTALKNNIYNSADAGLQVFRNIGSIDGSWPSSDHTLGLENNDAGTIVVNFHRAGYTSNNLWYNGGQFRFDTVVTSTSDMRAPIFYDSANTNRYLDLNSTAADAMVISGGIHISRDNVTGNGIILADDGDIVDLNDAYCSMRFSYGVRIFSANRGGTAVHTLHSDGNAYFNTSAQTPIFLVNSHSDNTKGYRIYNTSNSSVSAMFVNSSNQLVIAAGAVDQVNFNKKVLVNGVALGVNVAPSATAGRIDASNDIVAYSTSDERFKENITPISNALDKVKTLTGVEFDWRMETKDYHGYVGHDVGVIAQQVKAVLPEAVRTNANGYLAVRYEKLIGLLIEGMKEQQEQIEELKAQLNGLTK